MQVGRNPRKGSDEKSSGNNSGSAGSSPSRLAKQTSQFMIAPLTVYKHDWRKLFLPQKPQPNFVLSLPQDLSPQPRKFNQHLSKMESPQVSLSQRNLDEEFNQSISNKSQGSHAPTPVPTSVSLTAV